MSIVQTINTTVKRIPAWPLYIVLVVPGIWVFYQAVNNQLGADPLKALEFQLGVYALQLLVATLVITPLRNLLGINLIKYRRAIGLMAFFYVLAHLLTYLWLDQQWWWGAIYKDLTKRPYIIIGMLSALTLLPLAVTSNNASIKRLGAASWKKLHRLAYFAAMGGAVHYVLLRKIWEQEPITYVAVVAVLLMYRVVRANKAKFRAFRRAEG
jgi:sulfoxide reductase heme-binding subunit YedZ